MKKEKNVSESLKKKMFSKQLSLEFIFSLIYHDFESVYLRPNSRKQHLRFISAITALPLVKPEKFVGLHKNVLLCSAHASFWHYL